MSCRCRDFHTTLSSRCWDGVHELPGLAPPAGRVSAWAVTLFLSFLMHPRKCPIAPRSRILALGSASHFRCVLAESPSLAGLSRAHRLCPCVPLSFSPCQAGSLQHTGLAALQPSPLCPQLWISSGAWSFLPSPRSRVSAGVGCREGGTEGQERGWSSPLPQG